MVYVIKLLYRELLKQNENFRRDARISTLPLLGPPWAMFAVVILYLLFVNRWGPAWMAKRPAFEVKRPMQIYNLIQIAINIYVCVMSVRYSYLQPNFSFSCQGYDPNDRRPNMMILRYPGYVYYVSKYLDLLDTIFFVLRKKNSQITFLHVYHHAIMVYGVWVYCTLLFASHFTLTGCINSFIHVCMYSYYFTSTLDLKIDLTPWKRLLTQLQIIQFLILTLHYGVTLFNNWCHLDPFWNWVAFVQNLFVLILFCDFYVRAYVLKKGGKRRKTEAALLEGNGLQPVAEDAAVEMKRNL